MMLDWLRRSVKREDVYTKKLREYPRYLREDVERILYFDSIPHLREPEWYGMGSIVRETLGLTSDFPLNINIHHGVPFNEVDPCEFYRNGSGPILVNRIVYKELYERNFGRETFVFGTPQVYYRRLKKVQPSNTPVGTLAFPSHSSHYVRSIFDIEDYAELLLRLPHFCQPVSVCLYWKDLLLGRHQPFCKRNIKVDTAGHMFDPQFTARLYEIISRFRYTTGNDVGSHSVYSLEMGVPYFHFGAHASREEAEKNKDPAATYSQESIMLRTFYDLLPNYRDDLSISDPLARLVEYLHGCSTKLDFAGIKQAVVSASTT